MAIFIMILHGSLVDGERLKRRPEIKFSLEKPRGERRSAMFALIRTLRSLALERMPLSGAPALEPSRVSRNQRSA